MYDIIARCHRRSPGTRAKSLGLLEFRIHHLAKISGNPNWNLMEQMQPKSMHWLNHIKFSKELFALGLALGLFPLNLGKHHI